MANEGLVKETKDAEAAQLENRRKAAEARCQEMRRQHLAILGPHRNGCGPDQGACIAREEKTRIRPPGPSGPQKRYGEMDSRILWPPAQCQHGEE